MNWTDWTRGIFQSPDFLNFCQPPYFTVTYPQFPVSRHIDTYHLADDIIDDEGDSDDDQDDGGGSCRMTLSPFQHSKKGEGPANGWNITESD
jgi:hypothetical protein